jgi:RNA polymerase sigma factor (sigma-70 family)
MTAEYVPARGDNHARPIDSIKLRDRHAHELLERSRPMASSILGLLGAMNDEQAWLVAASADGEELAARESVQPMSEREPPEDDAADLERLETSIAWRQMVEHLEPRLRRVIELRYFGGLPRREIARRLGLQPRQVSYLQHCALRQLRVDATDA